MTHQGRQNIKLDWRRKFATVIANQITSISGMWQYKLLRLEICTRNRSCYRNDKVIVKASMKIDKRISSQTPNFDCSEMKHGSKIPIACSSLKMRVLISERLWHIVEYFMVRVCTSKDPLTFPSKCSSRKLFDEQNSFYQRSLWWLTGNKWVEDTWPQYEKIWKKARRSFP